MKDYKRKDKVEIETEAKDSDFAKEYGESATYMVQRLCNQNSPDTNQQHEMNSKVFGQK